MIEGFGTIDWQDFPLQKGFVIRKIVRWFFVGMILQ